MNLVAHGRADHTTPRTVQCSSPQCYVLRCRESNQNWRLNWLELVGVSLARAHFVYVSSTGLEFQIHPPQQVLKARVVAEGPAAAGQDTHYSQL